MLEKIPIQKRVLIALVSLTFITAITIGLIAAMLGISTLKKQALERMVAIRDLQASQVEGYFNSLREQILVHARSQDVRLALDRFSGGVPIDGQASHPDFQSYQQTLGIRSICLAEIGTGRILCSSDPSLATGVSIQETGAGGEMLAEAFSASVLATTPDHTFQTDFRDGPANTDEPQAFISCPVHSGEKVAAVLIYRISSDRINQIIRNSGTDQEGGLGRTVETLLLGKDGRIRNATRFKATGTPGRQTGRLTAIQSAFEGRTGSGPDRDYRGAHVFVAYKPLGIRNLDWIIISKVDRSESLAAMTTLYRRFILYTTILLLLAVYFSNLFARRLGRPIDALAKANERLRVQSAAMKSAANGIIITDTTGIVKWVNPAFTRLTGYGFKEIVGQNLDVLNSGVHDPEFYRNMWEKILAGEVWHDEIVNRRKDGTLYTEEMTITPVRGNHGGISEFVAIKQDITERKRLEQVVKSANERMEGELNVAKDIQMSMLPLVFPAFPENGDIDIHARLIPARKVGGDFYDFYFIDEENLCFVVGDVSGKGVPAALFMAVTKSLLKAGSRNETSTARILTKVNKEICLENENNLFVTVFIGILNTTTGYLTYSNAGHNPTFVLRHDGEILKLKDLHGVVVGAFESVEYRETVLQLSRGDTVFAYTDGVTEALDADNRMYTEDRLIRFLSGRTFNGCAELVEEAISDVVSFENGAEQADDITVLTVAYCEPSEDSLVDYLFTTIPNKLEHIALVIDQFKSFAEKHSISQEIVQKIDIVFDELLSNTISYAYQDGLPHEIDIKIRFYKEQLAVTIMDDGTPYNPFDRISPDTSLSIEDREIGGLGVHLVKLLVDDYHYEYKSQLGKNITSFKKSI